MAVWHLHKLLIVYFCPSNLKVKETAPCADVYFSIPNCKLTLPWDRVHCSTDDFNFRISTQSNWDFTVQVNSWSVSANPNLPLASIESNASAEGHPYYLPDSLCTQNVTSALVDPFRKLLHIVSGCDVSVFYLSSVDGKTTARVHQSVFWVYVNGVWCQFQLTLIQRINE